jgi:hypothetical protein
MELMETAVNTKCQRRSKRSELCQNSLGQDGTRLGILLLLVGPNGDGFGGQAFMEHYTDSRLPRCQLTRSQ